MTATDTGGTPRIVVGVDGSPSSRAALQWAVQQARLTGGSGAVIAWDFPIAAGYGWTPVAVLDDDSDFRAIAEKMLDEVIDDIVDPGSGVPVRRVVARGNPAQVLLDAAAGADLLVVGSRGHGGFADALLGSVSQHCVHHARCPVVIMSGDRQEAPTPPSAVPG